MRRVTGGIALFGSVGAVAGRALAQKPGGGSDSDRYVNDQPGQGRGPRSGLTDQDPGDAVGNGVGDTRAAGTGTPPERPPRSPFQPDNREAETGITDRDPSDPVRYGRSRPPERPPELNPFSDEGQTRRSGGVTDDDPTDPPGYGRGQPRGNRRCTDSDVGNNADESGRGRNC